MTTDADRERPIDITDLCEAARQGNILFTDHALRRMAKRRIGVDEVTDAILSGEVIENYPGDKYSPSCLVFGTTGRGRPLHVVCSAPPRVRVVTVYEPDAGEWVAHRIRRRS